MPVLYMHGATLFIQGLTSLLHARPIVSLLKMDSKQVKMTSRSTRAPTRGGPSNVSKHGRGRWLTYRRTAGSPIRGESIRDYIGRNIKERNQANDGSLHAGG